MGSSKRRLKEESDSENGSSDDDSGSGLNVLTIGGAVLGGIALIAGIVFFVSRSGGGSNKPAVEPCAGFKKCPEYPMPYAFGTWPRGPDAYTYTGKFPQGFIWGLGTASYQIEGAYKEGGRGASIWDTFSGANTVDMPGGNCSYCCKKAPCPINPGMASDAQGATGNVACDSYHMFNTDIALMKAQNLKHYRFSIAWPRMFPTGAATGDPNPEAVKHYNDFIDALKAAGIEPYVTLYHWDLPQALLSPPELGGWWHRDNKTGKPGGQIIPSFKHYADTCFRLFGDRVKVWITFNEAWTFTFLASGFGKAPGIPQYSDMEIDPWIAGHTVLLAHAEVVDLYRTTYAGGIGKIGITNNCDWREPHSESDGDIASAERAVLFQLGWFSDPIYGEHGDYPPEMRALYGSRLPEFTEDQKKKLKGSADFYGFNHYGTGWAAFDAYTPGADTSYAVVTEGDPDPFPKAQSKWLYGSGWGFRKILSWIKRRYNNPPLWVTEGGWSMDALNAMEGAADLPRIYYYANYTAEMQRAIEIDGVDVKAYFAWSLLDNYEWERGYVERFGTIFTDFDWGFDPNAPANQDMQPTPGHQVRTRKDSNCWLEAIWSGETMVHPGGFVCAGSESFNGTYSDAKHTGCQRSIVVNKDGVTGSVSGTMPAATALGISTCAGVGDTSFGPLPAKFSGSTIIANFSTNDGPKDLQGFWNKDSKKIFWGDGNVWTQTGVATLV